MRIRKGSQGVTLIELLIGLTLVAVITGMAVPNLRQASRANAVRAAAYELLSALAAARAGAVVEARSALLCPAALDHCVDAGTPAVEWRAFLEIDGRRVPFAGQALPSGITLRSSRSPMRFSPTASSMPGTLTICDATGVAAPRAVIVSQTGRARVADAPTASCAA